MATESASASSSNPSSSSLYSYPATTYFPLPFHLQNADPAAQQQYLPPSQIPPPVKIPTVAQTFPVPPPVVAGMYSLPQFQQAQQLFQRDAQTITPEAIEGVKAALANSEVDHKSDTKKKAIPRKAAGQSWEDPTLAEWPENDFRLFCGDLGNEVNDDVLSKAFSRFPSFNMARVIRDKRTGKTKGKYVGNRPIKLRKSTWRERTDVEALERQKTISDFTRMVAYNVVKGEKR
ncbi:hypothetical protein C4D60_Mb01t14430 [Musa balbisiana]|uniref:RRM domain-containing protein n=1 Tax=Musa balbisiana TaxID=52838 RepID=A0A4S8JMI1_MUSBA|nr:hypothetical protein C4D60_Mb01t14430 [Musa balbisiana]